MKTKILFLAVATFTLAATLSVVSHYFTPLPAILLLTVRWIAMGTLVLYALYKRSLTTWILVAMVIGAALGHDWPRVALHLRVLSMIFLRLIRAIIAPLLFGTLVSGIAAHSDLKKVGRMGVKNCTSADCLKGLGMRGRTLLRSFSFLAVVILLCSAWASGQTPQVRLIQIKSYWAGLGPSAASELVMRKEGGSFRLENRIVDSRLISEFVSRLNEAPLPHPEMSNLGITQEWLYAKSKTVPISYTIGRSVPSADQDELFRRSFTNSGIIAKIIPSLFRFSRTDDYPSIDVEVDFEDGSLTLVNSHSQYAFMLPWEITRRGRLTSTYNANVSRALAALLPENCTNRERIAGAGVAEELARAVRTYIDDDWNLLDAESKAGGSLARLRTEYSIQRAEVNSFHHPEYGKEWKRGRPHETNLHVDLRKAIFPNNFSEHLILLYRDGRVIGTDEFLVRAAKYETLAFNVTWLNRYIRENPRVPFQLMFVHGRSFGDKAVSVFARDMKAVKKEQLADEVRGVQNEVSLLLVGTTYAEAYWLVLPDKRMVLWRYGGRSGLLNWSASDFITKECAGYRVVFGGCVGAVVNADGTLVR
jgi:hypothetical protein